MNTDALGTARDGGAVAARARCSATLTVAEPHANGELLLQTSDSGRSGTSVPSGESCRLPRQRNIRSWHHVRRWSEFPIRVHDLTGDDLGLPTFRNRSLNSGFPLPLCGAEWVAGLALSKATVCLRPASSPRSSASRRRWRFVACALGHLPKELSFERRGLVPGESRVLEERDDLVSEHILRARESFRGCAQATALAHVLLGHRSANAAEVRDAPSEGARAGLHELEFVVRHRRAYRSFFPSASGHA